jgi:hypothetical protein
MPPIPPISYHHFTFNKNFLTLQITLKEEIVGERRPKDKAGFMDKSDVLPIFLPILTHKYENR